MNYPPLMIWEDAKENPPDCAGYYLAWVIWVNVPSFDDVYFDGYRHWYATNLKIRSERRTVTHWMPRPLKPNAQNTYPSDEQLKNPTIRDVADSLYEAFRKYQSVVTLIEE